MTVVIAGAGQAGASVALALREARYRGDVLLVGEEVHLPYERPPLSKDVLSGRKPPEDAMLHARPHFDAQRIRLRLGTRVVHIARAAKAIVLDSGERIGYDALVLATGLRPRPAIASALGERLHQVRTIDDALRLQLELRDGRRALVIGGGLLGLELAATARQMGCEVMVVERHPSLLFQSVAPVVGEVVTALHRRHGVRPRTGITPVAFEAQEQTVLATLSDGERLEVDFVISATGSIVNTELAEACGLQVHDGIIVDGFGRTSDPSIYAVGDVARHFNPLLGRTIRVESWHNAQKQSAAVAKVIAGAQVPYAEVPWFWSDQFDMNLQIVGYSSEWDRVIVRGDVASERFTAFYLQGERLQAANMVNNGRDVRLATEWIAKRTPLDVEKLGQTAVPLAQSVINASVAA